MQRLGSFVLAGTHTLSTLALSTLALSTLATGCSTNPSTGRSQFILLSPDQVNAMGADATPTMIEEFGGEVESAELREYVRTVGDRLAAHVEPAYAEIEWEFYVLDSDVINAFALPGGRIFVTRGLLARFDHEAQVAGVLGHEIGHVTGRHADERLSQALAAELGLAVLGQYTDSELTVVGADLATQTALLGFGRNQESESDRQGLKYMVAAGYDPRGMAQVLEVLISANTGPRPPELFSTHPNPERRLEDIREMLAGPYAYTRNNPGYRRYGGRFRRGARPYLEMAR